MKKYNHAYDIAFSLESYDPKGEVSAGELVAALEKRLEEFKKDPNLILECAGLPYDSYSFDDGK